MSNYSKYGNRDGEKLTAEFTSGQLVVAICVSLFVILVSFLLGVLVGRYDGSRSPRQTAAVTQPETPSAQQPESVQTSPRTDTMTTPAPAAVVPPEAAAAKEVPLDHQPWPTARVRDLDPLPQPGQMAPGPETPDTIAKTPETGAPPAVPASNAVPVPAPAPAAPPAPAADTSTVVNAAVVTPPGTPVAPVAAAPEPPKAAPEAPGEPVVPMPPISTPVPVNQPVPKTENPSPVSANTGKPAESGKYIVQLAAFPGAGREASAQAFVAKIRPIVGKEPTIVSDAQSARVVLTGYKNRAAAQAACAELKKKPGLDEAWIRPVP